MNEDISIIDGHNSFLTEKSTVLLTQAKRTLEDEKEMITPPSSTVRKTMKEVNKRPSHPLSPDHSSYCKIKAATKLEAIQAPKNIFIPKND